MFERATAAKRFPLQLRLDSGQRILAPQGEAILGWLGGASAGAAPQMTVAPAKCSRHIRHRALSMRAIFLREGMILLLFWMSPASFPAKLDAILRTVSLLRPYQEAKPPSLPPMANGSLFGSAGTALRRTSQSERCGDASSPWAETALARGEPSNTTTFLMLGVALFSTLPVRSPYRAPMNSPPM